MLVLCWYFFSVSVTASLVFFSIRIAVTLARSRQNLELSTHLALF